MYLFSWFKQGHGLEKKYVLQVRTSSNNPMSKSPGTISDFTKLQPSSSVNIFQRELPTLKKGLQMNWTQIYLNSAFAYLLRLNCIDDVYNVQVFI